MQFDPQKLNPTICRRMLVLHLMQTLPKPNVPALERATGWARRTLQDLINIGLPGHGAVLEFVQERGARNNEGHYRLVSAGSFDMEWIQQHQTQIRAVLELPPEKKV